MISKLSMQLNTIFPLPRDLGHSSVVKAGGQGGKGTFAIVSTIEKEKKTDYNVQISLAAPVTYFQLLNCS